MKCAYTTVDFKYVYLLWSGTMHTGVTIFLSGTKYSMYTYQVQGKVVLLLAKWSITRKVVLLRYSTAHGRGL
jgi:hypothetical protein